MYVCVYVCVCVSIYIQTHIYTHTLIKEKEKKILISNVLVESLLYYYDSLNIIGPSLSPAFHFRLELYNFTPTANEKDKKRLYLLKR